MRIMSRVLERPIKYLLENCKVKLKIGNGKYYERNYLFCNIHFIGYNENVTYVTPSKAINELSKITFCACWIALSDNISILNI